MSTTVRVFYPQGATDAVFAARRYNWDGSSGYDVYLDIRYESGDFQTVGPATLGTGVDATTGLTYTDITFTMSAANLNEIGEHQYRIRFLNTATSAPHYVPMGKKRGILCISEDK